MQSLLLAAVLLWSAQAKLLSRHAPHAARRSALSRLSARPETLYRLVGGVEAVVGLSLFLPSRIPAAAAVFLSVGFLSFLSYAHRVAPDSSCGCLGAQSAPVSARSFYRAGLLLLVSASAVFFPMPFSVGGTTLVMGGLLAVVVLSPELDHLWLLPWRRAWARWTHPLSSPNAFDVPLESTVEQLHHSPVFRRLAADLTSDVREHWDAEEWRILVYTLRSAERTGSAVFAVPRLRYAPETVRATVVDLV